MHPVWHHLSSIDTSRLYEERGSRWRRFDGCCRHRTDGGKFPASPELQYAVKVGVLTGSVVSALLRMLVLRFAPHKRR